MCEEQLSSAPGSPAFAQAPSCAIVVFDLFGWSSCLICFVGRVGVLLLSIM
jgi:hypothetical protein